MKVKFSSTPNYRTKQHKMKVKFSRTPNYHTEQHKMKVKFSSTPNYHTKQQKIKVKFSVLCTFVSELDNIQKLAVITISRVQRDVGYNPRDAYGPHQVLLPAIYTKINEVTEPCWPQSFTNTPLVAPQDFVYYTSLSLHRRRKLFM
jgi:hypothetical protein